MAITHLLDEEAAAVPADAEEKAADEFMTPAYEQIAALAFSYWEARGGRGGSPWEDWFRAERELREREQRER